MNEVKENVQTAVASEQTKASKTRSRKAKPEASPKAKVGAKAKASPKPPKTKPPKKGRDGSVVGFAAKSQQDVPWTAKKAAFYRSLKKIGGTGTSTAIAKASNGKITAGNARHFGYHGVGSGLIKVETAGGPNSSEQVVRGFVFVLTAKGRKCDPDAELKRANK